jgi:hypothetical protein
VKHGTLAPIYHPILQTKRKSIQEFWRLEETDESASVDVTDESSERRKRMGAYSRLREHTNNPTMFSCLNLIGKLVGPTTRPAIHTSLPSQRSSEYHF